MYQCEVAAFIGKFYDVNNIPAAAIRLGNTW